MEIENRFRIRFTEDDEACLCSVGDLVDAIGRKLGRPGTDAR
jgi:acyl carrier protein